MSDLTNRNREHIENHIRRVDQQILDALLRIEEILKDMLNAKLADMPLNALKPVEPINKEPGGITEVKRRGRR